MSEETTSPEDNRIIPLLMDALWYPLRRWPWWLVIVGCVAENWIVLWMMQHSVRLPGLIVYLSVLLYGVVVRCYFSAMETTLSGYGEESWQGSGFSMDGLWSSIGTLLGVAALSWAPTFVAALALAHQGADLEPWVSITGALGCEYFCMALIGTVAFGGLTGAMPQHVFPAIIRCGASYGLSSLSLMFVPWLLESAFNLWGRDSLGGMLVTFIIAGYLLLAQARMTGLVYLANKERIGWE